MVDKPDATGTYYPRNRSYDPSTARFTQEDPLGLAGGLNVYGFASGDPVDFSDPFGLSCEVQGNCSQSDVAGPGKRSADLGTRGNEIRDECGQSTMCQKLIEQYWRGKGDLTLTEWQFNDIVREAATKGKVVGEKEVTFAGQSATARSISLYGSDKYAKAFGVATIYFDKAGKAIGFYDFENFDKKRFGTRPLRREIQTRAVAALSPKSAKAFNITYP